MDKTQRNDLPSLSIRRPVLVLVVNLLIILAGLAALLAVEVRELPNIDRPVVSVRVDFPGASPETMDAEVVSLLEGAVARVSGRDVSGASEHAPSVTAARAAKIGNVFVRCIYDSRERRRV